MEEALTIGQVAASAARISAQVGRRPPSSCSPRISAYSSASQYTSSVTTMETASGRVGSGRVGTWSPAAAKTAAVMIVP